MASLKSCPFCGGIAEVISTGKYEYSVLCNGCGVFIGHTDKGMTDFYRSGEDAVRDWNRRVKDDV